MDVFISVYLGLSAIFFFWLGRTVWTLRKTVQAQASTIEAFHTLVDGMKTLLDSTDEPAMRERFKAYKEIVDLEKEANERQVKEETRNALKKVSEGSLSSIKSILKDSEELFFKMFNLVFSLMLYVPPEKRSALIEEVDFGEIHEKIKESVESVAAKAPYISAEDQKGAKRLAQMFTDLKLPPLPKED